MVKNKIIQTIFGLKNGESAKLQDVYPNVLQEVLGDFNKFETMGCDYWASTNHYDIEGNMFNGTAEITKI